MRRLSLLLLAALAAAGSTALAQDTSRLALSPSSAEGIVGKNVLVGPFTLKNSSRNPFEVQLEPVLLEQRRDGGLTIGETDSSRRAAENFLNLKSTAFDFPPGASESFRARVRAVPPLGSLYAGLLFKAAPKTPGEGITNALELVATLYLHPPKKRRRIDFETKPIRAEQAGVRRLRFLVDVKNVGNYYTNVTGRLRLRDRSGRSVLTGPLEGLKILPGAVVDLPLETAQVIPPGRYEADATIKAGGKRFRAAGSIALFGPSEVATRTAKLEDPSPEAYRGEPYEMEIPYRNTGNVRFRPGAEVTVTPQPTGRDVEVDPDVTEAEPGERGLITSSVELADDVTTFLVHVRLVIDGRTVDERTFSVTRAEKRGFLDKLKDWITEHALLVVLALLVLMAVGAFFALRHVRRLRDAATAATPGAAAASATGLVDLNTADLETLATLPRVGPRAAQRIVEHREEYGPYAAVDDLARLEGFDEERVAALRGRVTVG